MNTKALTYCIIFILFVVLKQSAFCQNYKEKTYRIAFYNTENFFDTYRDTTKSDEEYTPYGKKRWGKSKYETKCLRLFKAISALNENNNLLCVGLAEVENSRVLNDLCRGTPLRYDDFNFIHFESNDPRGIDVALLYRASALNILNSYPIKIMFNSDTTSRSRDILYVYAAMKEEPYEKIHLFIVHFPSKYSGALESDIKRYTAGKVLRKAMDSISSVFIGEKVLAMGDFNAEVGERPLIEGIGFKNTYSEMGNRDYLNLMCKFSPEEGSHKFREKWSLIDHIIVNIAWLKNGNNAEAYIFKPSFLLINDDSYFGEKPFRSFHGPRYLGGYSDHLPVYIDFNSTLSTHPTLP